ncbi:phage head closure protein [Dysgonomonas sp. Marseille-P4677]|uniref:phage head closure protein n=1 Tax=Dysgonomonas sp. Marseille-P4677 TaxID=2364790 RepID=UPI0019132C7B|nr:phage head closure protein [Dysgonomonas sp. Marseille-P4677]MBK5721372.1 phage head closure protein [Dysgonomonas sp. Marseille-P4677]
MRAGLLREILVIQELRPVQSASGAMKKDYVSILKVRGNKLKLTAVMDRDGVNAGEEFLGDMIIFQIRYNPNINDSQRVIFQNIKYKIKLIDKQTDNSLLLTLQKINE